MLSETKKDIFVMIYQFIFAGLCFWIATFVGLQPSVSGGVISPYAKFSISSEAWRWIIIGFSLIGVLGLYIQRKIHLKGEKTR